MNKNFAACFMAALFAVGGASPALAQSDGSFDTTSTGSLTVSASVPSMVRVSGLSDVTFSAVDPSTSVSNDQTICVYSNTANGKYNITASGGGATEDFLLVNGALPSIAYTVAFNDDPTALTGDNLIKQTALTNQASLATDKDCTGGESAKLFVGIASSELQKMQAGLAYSGTLTLVVAPE